MKLQYISYDALETVKSNLGIWTRSFGLDSSDRLKKEMDGPLFQDTKFTVEDFTLDTSAEKPFQTDTSNVMCLYKKLDFLSPSQASDERLWAGLCLGPFWSYVKYRWNIDGNCTEENIRQHFFFPSGGTRRALMRNALSRLWWIGHFTYDETRDDPWEFTKFVCRSSDNVKHIFERTTFDNPAVLRPFLSAVIDAEEEGIPVNTDTMGELSKYLNLLSGVYILDYLSADRIYAKTYAKIKEIGRPEEKQEKPVSE